MRLLLPILLLASPASAMSITEMLAKYPVRATVPTAKATSAVESCLGMRSLDWQFDLTILRDGDRSFMAVTNQRKAVMAFKLDGQRITVHSIRSFQRQAVEAATACA